MSAVATKPRMTFYNFDKIYSYNGVYNFLCGARGLGKTYGAKYKAVKAAIEKGDQFIYLRRWKDELKKSKESFFADLAAEGAFPGIDFRVMGYYAQMAPEETRDVKKREWKTIGYFIPLSTAQSVKSVSYPLVRTIIFDEFIIEKGRTQYISNEAEVFNNFYSTVDRYKDKTRVFFLANSVSITNPYFLYYDIKPVSGQEWIKSHENFIVCHFADSKDFQNDVFKTRFGKFIQNTDYADYAVKSEFRDNHDGLLEEKSPEANYVFTLETKTGTFSVWVDYKEMDYYVQKKRPKVENVMTLLPEQMSESKTLLTVNDRLIQNMRTAFRHGKAQFDSAQSRNAFVEIFKR